MDSQMNGCCYNNNLHLASEKIFEKCDFHSESTNENYSVVVSEGKSGDLYGVIDNGEEGILLNSKYNPIKEAEVWAEHIVKEETLVYVVFGSELGHRLKALLNRISDKAKIIVVEPDAHNFKRILSYIDFSELLKDDRITWWVGTVNKNVDAFIEQNLNQNNYSKTNIVALPNYELLYQSSYKELMLKMRNAILAVSQNISTRERYKFEWQKNVIKNIRSFVKSKTIMEVNDVLTGLPVVVVSSGPSLSKNIDLLSKYQNRFVIICASSSLKLLRGKGVRPDIVVSIHGDEHVYPSVENINYDDSILVYPMESYYKVQEEHNGDKIVIQSNVIAMKKLYDVTSKKAGLIECGFSVANTAFSVAVHMGANPIIFVGQDLAFEGEKVHAEGVISNAVDNNYTSDKVEEEQFVMVKGINSEEVRSCYVFLTYLNWFQMKIANLPHVKCIDATEGGALIEGTEVKALQKVIEEVAIEELDKSQINHKIIQTNAAVDPEIVLKYITEIKQLIRRVGKKAQDAKKYNEEIERYYIRDQYMHKSGEIRKLGKKLDKIDGYFTESLEGLEFFGQLLVTVLRELYKIDIDNSKLEEREKGISAVNAGRLLYETVVEAVGFVMPLLNDLEEYLKKSIE